MHAKASRALPPRPPSQGIPDPTPALRAQLEASWQPKYSDADASKMDEAYGKLAGGDSAGFDMDKLGEGAEQAGGWTMADEFDAEDEEYGDDRPDADKVHPWAQASGCSDLVDLHQLHAEE